MRKPTAIDLIIRADDLGMCHAVNRGIYKAWREGIVTTACLMAPGPWFWEAAELCRKNPALDVGVHLTLFSEWKQLRWRPLSSERESRSFTDKDGYFHPHPQALLRAGPGWSHIGKEFSRQIDWIKRRGISPSHLSLHWTRPHAYPAVLQRIVKTLSEKYGLPVSGRNGENIVPLDFLSGDISGAAGHAIFLRDLKPGLNMAVVHPAIDTHEIRAFSMRWRSPYRIDHRFAELAGLTNRALAEKLKSHGVRLRDYRGPAGASQ